MSDSTFYIGRSVDLLASSQSAPAAAQTVRYDPDDLTTHGIIVGMTGSGKTGLLINLLEEAALRGLPSIVIDPKGDLTNLLLHFPDLLPSDFEPWIDPETARRQKLTVPELAEATSARWREGLQNWDLDRDELAALQQAVDYVVFTPGSSAGQPVNLLSSFAPPRGLTWDEHREVLRERISATVTALLGLSGLDASDPLRSREHILLSNILENAWSQNRALNLTELILQTQTPPFERLGVFPVNSFFPEKERSVLAYRLNNLLASPSFQAWTEGQPMDVQDFFYTPQGRPRMSIFYLAHLDENERMFFVTLLLASVESWMRAQRGSSGLRALLAFDEIVGYLPPVANPPSRPVLLRLLKQSRAFGLGLLLATQNPVDLDYKSLSNAGTWFIGRLQTERDKLRLLEGLQVLEGGVDSAVYDRLISALRPRVFLMHNIHNPGGAATFQTRWCLNYLAGPLTRAQLGGLKPLGSGFEPDPTLPPAEPVPAPVQPLPETVKAAVVFAPAVPLQADPLPVSGTAGDTPFMSASRTPPSPPAGVNALFLPPLLSLGQALGRLGGSFVGPARPEGLVYRPGLFYQAEVSYHSLRYGLDTSRRVAALVAGLEGARIDWEACAHEPLDPARLDAAPLPEARFLALPGWLASARSLSGLQKDFIDWVYRSAALRLWANPTLKLYSEADESQPSFRRKCDEAARAGLKTEIEKITAGFAGKLTLLERKLERQELKVKKNEDEVSRRRMEELSTGAEVFFSVFSRRKRSLSTSLSKSRMTSQAAADRDAAEKTLESLEDEYNALKKQRDEAVRQAQERWARAVGEITEVPVVPMKKDIYLEAGGLIWLPVYIVAAEGRTFEAPAY
jgi:hypothetical protein